MIDTTVLIIIIFEIIAILIVIIMWIVTAIVEKIEARKETKRWSRIMEGECNRTLNSIDKIIREMRDFTEEEKQKYNESLSKLFKKTGRKVL